MARVRKRQPGGGRKPAGPIQGKVSTFSTRITAETRAALEAEAAAAKPRRKSISQVAEQLLQLGLERRRDQELDDPSRALGFLIGGIAEHCWAVAEDGRRCQWNTDRTVFEAFRLAVIMLLDRLRPAGEIDGSLEGPLVGQSPEQHAEQIFRTVWRALQTAQPASPSEIEALMDRPIPLAAAAISRGQYHLSRAKRALKIGVEEAKR